MTCFFRLAHSILARMFQTCFSPSGNMSADSVSRGQFSISLRKLQIQPGKSKKSAPNCQNMVFHQNPDVPDEKSRHRMNIFKSPTGSLESVSGLIIPHSNRPFLFSTRCVIWSPTWRILRLVPVQTLWAPPHPARPVAGFCKKNFGV